MSTSPTPASAPSPIGRWLAVLATVVVVATLVAAFMVMRSPSEERQVTLDLRRVQDLLRSRAGCPRTWPRWRSSPAACCPRATR